MTQLSFVLLTNSIKSLLVKVCEGMSNSFIALVAEDPSTSSMSKRCGRERLVTICTSLDNDEFLSVVDAVVTAFMRLSA